MTELPKIPKKWMYEPTKDDIDFCRKVASLNDALFKRGKSTGNYVAKYVRLGDSSRPAA